MNYRILYSKSFQAIIPCFLIFMIQGQAWCQSSVHLGQGIMSGEINTTSVILQTRLTASEEMRDGELLGVDGVGRFEVSQDEGFSQVVQSQFIKAEPSHDYIIKTKIEGLSPNTHYYYRIQYGDNANQLKTSPTGTFRTLSGPEDHSPISFVVVTGMNYHKFHYGNYERSQAYAGEDKEEGYPALRAILESNTDYFIGTGDNVYFDHPVERNYQRAVKAGKNPHPGLFDGKEVTDEKGMRTKYHQQFSQQRFKDLFREVGTYWEKDDHDYRFNDADPFMDLPISHELGIKNFREQLPVISPDNPASETYRTFRMNADLQIWLVEGRDFRSANDEEDGPNKTLWGHTQLEWLKSSLLSSDATYKLLISPTPMVGPDDAYKKDNHVNHLGFRHEGDAFFKWLLDNDFLNKHFYIICGDRHWKYHARHPSGFEEFSCGALVDNNSRAGRLAGDPRSTDPDALITQYFIEGTPEQASGGFLKVTVSRQGDKPMALFEWMDENGVVLYKTVK